MRQTFLSFSWTQSVFFVGLLPPSSSPLPLVSCVPSPASYVPERGNRVKFLWVISITMKYKNIQAECK